MNRQNLYDQVVEIYEKSGEPTNLEQANLLLAMGDLLNKSADKKRHTLPLPYYEYWEKELKEIIPDITPEEILTLHSRFLYTKNSFEYKDAQEIKRNLSVSREIPWWLQYDAFKRGVPGHFRDGVENVGHGVEEIIHHARH